MLPSSFDPGQPFGLRGKDGTLVLDRSAADLLNQMLAATRGGGRMSVAAPLLISEGASGRALGVSGPTVIHAQLSGSGNPYSFQQAYYEPGTGFVPFAAGHSGTRAYEANGKADLDGKFVELTYEPISDDWRFQWIGYGCNVIPSICVTAISSCPGNPAISGATVTLKQGSTTVATCTTSREIRTLAMSASGDGLYTNGTDFVLGISGGGGAGASALFDVVGGYPTNLRILDGGHDFDGSAITFDFSASAGGSGATAVATLVVGCCFRGLAFGSYVVTIDADGYPTYTSPTLKIPPCSVSISPLMTPNKALVLVWVGACGVVEGSVLSPQMTGVTVEAKQGGITVATGVTDSTGHVTLRVPLGFTTSFTATETATGRYDPRTVTGGPYSTTCPSNSPITDVQILLPAGSAYHCLAGCLVPATLTLYLSTPADGAWTLPYDPSNNFYWATNGTIWYAFNGIALYRGGGTTVDVTNCCTINLIGNNVPNSNWTPSYVCPPSYFATFTPGPTGPYRGRCSGSITSFPGWLGSAGGGGAITLTT